MSFVGENLLQMSHPRWGCGGFHLIGMHVVVEEAVMTSDVRFEILNLFLCLASSTAIKREHSPLVASAKGGVHEVVVKCDDIPWVRIQGDRWYVSLFDAPQLHGISGPTRRP
jgi:hypothetical protein